MIKQTLHFRNNSFSFCCLATLFRVQTLSGPSTLSRPSTLLRPSTLSRVETLSRLATMVDAFPSLLLSEVVFALRVRVGRRGKHQHVRDLRLSRARRLLRLRRLRLLLRRHRLLLRLLELAERAQQINFPPLGARRDRLGAALQQVQRLACLLC